MILNDFVNRFERWIKASHKVAHIETFMVPNIQGLGQLEGVLEISCQSDKIISRIDNGTTNRF